MSPLLSSRSFRHLLPPKRLAFVEACLIGLVSGLAAVLLKQGGGMLGTWRIQSSQQVPAILVLPAIGLIGGCLAGLLVESFAPEASGSGVSQVKAILERSPVALNLRVAAVKLVSTILVMGAGLPLGRQGPTVQIGAALANTLSRWVPTSPDHRRQMIAAGAAAGLAAGFNAPITGVLFVVEELLHEVSSLTLGTAILSSFTGAVVSRLLGGLDWGLNRDPTDSLVVFTALDIPLMLFLGVLVGVWAGIFNLGILGSLALNRRFVKLSLPLRIGLAGLVSGAAIALLPATFRDNTGLWGFLSSGEADIALVATAFIAKFLMTLLTYGSGAPGGLFAPSLILGAALGALVALCSQALLGIGDQTTYAYAGMGAFFSAVAKVPVTAIVIVFEISTDFNLVLPLMITSVVAYLVSDLIAKGSLYDELLKRNNLQPASEPSQNNELLATLTADDVMQRQVETLESHLTLDEVRLAFSRSHHRGFPVVENGKLVGTISQSDLPESSPSSPEKMRLKEIMTPQPVTVSPSDSLAEVLYNLNHYKISRLPVTDGRHLVGIITRSDIIRAEFDRLTVQLERSKRVGVPSYTVYQTRAPELGRGRILVPLANPNTAPMLLQMAAAIARDRNYELECLQVIRIPRHQLPTETPVRTARSRRLLQPAVRLGQHSGIPVHTQIKVSHDIAQAVLDTVRERHINLLLMGWTGRSGGGDWIFGDTVDPLIRHADCDLALVKLGRPDPESPEACPLPLFNRWLVPLSGGPHTKRAIELLPALVSLSSQPKIQLCQVFDPENTTRDKTPLRDAKVFLRQRLNCPILATPLLGTSVAATIARWERKKHYDAIVLGASGKGMLERALEGNIPNAIAQNCRCTVILFRSARS
ncbi:MAG: CBS domain-containing protein [Cyanobacteria bacterium J055]|nr:MAG: CBS domain-containing protein [Cyanobacteria bacterium J055]